MKRILILDDISDYNNRERLDNTMVILDNGKVLSNQEGEKNYTIDMIKLYEILSNAADKPN